MKNTVLSVIRHLLTFAGGLLVAKGLVSEDTASQLAGLIPTVVGLVWGALDEHKAENKKVVE